MNLIQMPTVEPDRQKYLNLLLTHSELMLTQSKLTATLKKLSLTLERVQIAAIRSQNDLVAARKKLVKSVDYDGAGSAGRHRKDVVA